MIKSQWLEPPRSRIFFHGPKDVRAIKIQLHVVSFSSGFRAPLNPLLSFIMVSWLFVLYYIAFLTRSMAIRDPIYIFVNLSYIRIKSDVAAM